MYPNDYLNNIVNKIPATNTIPNDDRTGSFFIIPFLQKSGSSHHVSVSFQN